MGYADFLEKLDERRKLDIEYQAIDSERARLLSPKESISFYVCSVKHKREISIDPLRIESVLIHLDETDLAYLVHKAKGRLAEEKLAAIEDVNNRFDGLFDDRAV